MLPHRVRLSLRDALATHTFAIGEAMNRIASLARGRGYVRVLFACLRLSCVLVAVQLGGVVHVISDAWRDASAAASHAQENCPDDDSDRECPPGCPDCHRVHHPSAVPMRDARPAAPTVLAAPAHAVRAAPTEDVPADPDPSGFFRPPRVLSVVG